jgi:uncharacterized protein
MQKKPELPNLKLIEEMHQFPTMFTFKAIGDQHPDFLSDVLNRATQAIGPTRSIEHSIRISSGGNHAAVTLKVHCETAHEVHGVYEELLKVAGLRALF